MRSNAFGVVAPPEISDEDPLLKKIGVILTRQSVVLQPRNSFGLALWAIMMNQREGLVGLDVLPYYHAAMLSFLQEALDVTNAIEDWSLLDPTRKVKMWVGMKWQAETFKGFFTD
jgi:hypothetical protein